MALPILVLIAILAAAIIIGDLVRPKPKLDSAKPGSFSDNSFPTATENRPVQYFCGTIKHEGPNVIWQGDTHIEPLYKKIRTGLFSTQQIITHYHYHSGLDLAWGFGPNARLKKILAEELVAWEGDITGGTTINIGTTASELFGGDERDGGWSTLIDYYDGDPNQLANPYLESILGAGNVPGYRDIIHFVWRGWTSSNGRGYIGTRETMKKIACIFERIVDVLSQSAYTEILTAGGKKQANPIDVIYELMTDYRMALGMPALSLNLASFQAAQITCFNEGSGVSAQFDNQRAVGEFIIELLANLDGVIFQNFSAASPEYVIALARDDYNPATLPIYDETHIHELQDFSNSSYDETINEIKIPFIYADDDFKETTAIAQDMANVATQNGALNTATIQLIGISDPQDATRKALRELKKRSTPLIKCTALFDATAFDLRIGGVFKLNWNIFEDRPDDPVVKTKIMRIAAINYGELRNGYIPVTIIQDIFGLADGIFSAPLATGGYTTQPSDAVQLSTTANGDVVSLEQPYLETGDDDGQPWVIAGRPNEGQQAFDVYIDSGNGYLLKNSNVQFAPTATLDTTMARVTADTIASVVLTAVSDCSQLEDATADEVHNGKNLFYMDGEIFGFETHTLVGTVLTLNNVWRATVDTTMRKSHASGSKAYFFTYGSALVEDAYAGGTALNIKALSRSSTQLAALTGATAMALTINQRARRPIAPANISIAGSVTEGDIPATGDIVLTWIGRNRKNISRVLKQSDAYLNEANAKTTIKVYGNAGSLIHTQSNIDLLTWTYTNAQETADAGSLQDWLTFVIYEIRDGLTSYQAQIRQVKRVGVVSSPPALPTFTPSGTYVAPPSLAGTYVYPTVTTAPDGTIVAIANGSVPEIVVAEALDSILTDPITSDVLVDVITGNVMEG